MRNAIILPLTILLAGCLGERAKSTDVHPEKIQQAIASTMGQWSEGRLAKDKWPEAIKELDPIDIYSDRMNAVIPLFKEDGIESGIYVYVTISSYLPTDGDGWKFTSIGDDVWRYTSVLGAQE